MCFYRKITVLCDDAECDYASTAARPQQFTHTNNFLFINEGCIKHV